MSQKFYLVFVSADAHAPPLISRTFARFDNALKQAQLFARANDTARQFFGGPAAIITITEG